MQYPRVLDYVWNGDGFLNSLLASPKVNVSGWSTPRFSGFYSRSNRIPKPPRPSTGSHSNWPLAPISRTLCTVNRPYQMIFIYISEPFISIHTHITWIQFTFNPSQSIYKLLYASTSENSWLILLALTLPLLKCLR